MVADFLENSLKCLNKLTLDLMVSQDAKEFLLAAAGPICKIILKNTDNRAVLKQSVL